MGTAKEEVQKMLKQIPDGASFEDIQYHIYVREKIERGLRDINEGYVLSQEEVERRWSTRSLGTLGTRRTTKPRRQGIRRLVW